MRLPPRALAAAAGVAGGLVATLFGGMAGPFYAIYLRALDLDKRRFRASMSSVLLCLGLVRAGGYGGLGFYDRRAIAVLVLFAPVMALAMLAGDRWHARLDQAKFERIVAALLRAERLRAAAQVDGGAPSPGPSGRCISTLSTQRPNL